jgi:hypothetical protein
MGISSGKPTKNYGQSPFLMGKSFFLAIFNSYVYVKLLEGIDGGILYNIYIYISYVYISV